jgi:hypothetical protein
MLGLSAQIRLLVAAFACVFAFAIPATAIAAENGGVSPTDPEFQPAGKAKLLPNGLAIPPVDAPPEVKAIIEAGNEIATLPYRYGGGHRLDFKDTAYDCSGSISYALRAGGFLESPLDSSSFMKWGEKGLGKWITVYTNPGHAYMVVAGLRFDTSMRTPLARASVRRVRTPRGTRKIKVVSSRWSSKMRSSRGYAKRFIPGF